MGSQGLLLLIGHSLGTAVAMHYAAQHPTKLAGLVLLGAARSAAHIPAIKARMLEMAANTRSNGIAWAADLACKSNFPSDVKRPVEAEARKDVFDAVSGSDVEGYARTCEMMVDESHKDPACAGSRPLRADIN
ncbi:uncharacterized protein DNG_09867 [Cephalotrichum gorgonifer]|uniref:AB hydrolase-1 domain-containing protein n=1 Tax=Cephalotrichum gorgonifer TaxID=2041049 RepID=A0AAE8N874_9PEZI|nr:uncharacterized protein DNG_09867 [Cephalotrichum gorgonifer]